MSDRMKRRGRPRIHDEMERRVEVCVTVPRRLKLAMKLLARQQRTSVSQITSRCYRRLAEFHQLEKYRSAGL